MTAIVLHLIVLSAKIVLLGGIAWLQLFLLRRAPAWSLSRMCSVALAAIVLLAAGDMLAPHWMPRAPVYNFTAASSHAASSTASRANFESWLAVLWMAGAAFTLFRVVVGRADIAMMRRRSMPLSTPLDHNPGIDVRIADVQTPILIGLLRPVILLPEAARAWTAQQRRMVLTHESTHFRQGDCWANLLAQIVRAMFWFHPVVWLLVARMSREQELTCDEAVVAAGHSPQDYAAFLLDTVRGLKSREIFACAMAGAGAQSLKRRFASMLEPRVDPMPRRQLTRRIAVTLALFAILATALILVRPVWSQNERQNQPEVYTVGGDVTQHEVLTKIEPQYSEEARRHKISGPVHVKLIVTAEGTPDEIEVTDGIGYGLDQSAIDAISQWTFQPATKNGKAVPVWANVLVNFRLL